MKEAATEGDITSGAKGNKKPIFTSTMNTKICLFLLKNEKKKTPWQLQVASVKKGVWDQLIR